MSFEITEAFVKQYSANVFHLSQQKGSRLQERVRKETQQSEAKFFERIGSVEAMEKTGRHSMVEYSDTPHSRRRVSLVDYFHADLVDEEDKLRVGFSEATVLEKGSVYSCRPSPIDSSINILPSL